MLASGGWHRPFRPSTLRVLRRSVGWTVSSPARRALGSKRGVPMSRDIALRWRDAFFAAVQQHETAQQLKEAALAGRLGDWTKGLTGLVVRSCEALGWRAAAKG